MNTIISAATGGLVAAFVKPWFMGLYSSRNRYDVAALSNGILAGLVAITGICDRVDPWAALIIGLIGGLVYAGACKLCDWLNVDDPIEASSVHGFTGMWGLIACGIFDNEEGLFAKDDNVAASARWKYFGFQIIGMLAIIAWVAFLSAGYFILMRILQLLRVPLLEQIIGLDIAEMGSAIHISKKVEDQVIRSDSIRKSSTLRRGRSTDQMQAEFGDAKQYNPGINDADSPATATNPKVRPEEEPAPFSLREMNEDKA